VLPSMHILSANRCCTHADANGVKQPSLCCGDPCLGVSCAWNVSLLLDISAPTTRHGNHVNGRFAVVCMGYRSTRYS